MLMVKEEEEEAPVNHRPCADLHDLKPHHIKEKQEKVYISLGGEQLNGKEEIDAIRFSANATPIKSEDDKQSPLLSQLYQDKIKGEELPEEMDREESIRIQDHGHGSIFLETKKDEDDVDVEHPVSELKHWKESRAPESDGNINDPFSSSEFAEKNVTVQQRCPCCRLQTVIKVTLSSSAEWCVSLPVTQDTSGLPVTSLSE
ncbi:hypothetical protein ATANTOWER_027776 [Ataeniobius toweri]|uniref:Uncharacterized protein n=1 Tax=Ataeniobius toweri TaxID=208326 RepID=A0ABU7CMV5_9TELE|nr:hypothetical protein [Ataeniobius toweri]